MEEEHNGYQFAEWTMNDTFIFKLLVCCIFLVDYRGQIVYAPSS